MPRCYIFILAILCLLNSCKKKERELLTQEEKQWLKDHPNLRISVFGHVPPYQFFNEDGEVQGIFIDYLGLIEEKIDYKFERVPYKVNEWENVIADSKKNNINLILEIQKTEKREEFLNFFKPLFNADVVVVSRKNELTDLKFNELDKINIVVPKNYMVEDLILEKFPNIKLSIEKSPLECLHALNEGKYDAYVGIKGTTSFFIENRNLENLTVRLTTPFKYKPTIAVTKQNKELIKIIDKVIKSIKLNEVDLIYNKWLLKKSWPFYYNPKFWFSLISITGFILGTILFFNQRLKTLLNKKTKALRTALIKAEESNALKTAFINNISHEIRTPMNSIIGYSELLKNEFNTKEQREDYIEHISKSGEQLVSTIDNLIEVSKLKSKNFELNKEKVNLYDFFSSITDKLKKQIQGKELSLIYLNNEPNTNAFFDRKKVKKAVILVIDNAIKFTKKGSVEISHKITNKDLEISISDTGIGIDEDHKNRIFESFYKLEKGETDKAGGLGLGLTIAKENIEAMKGTISINSLKNKGTNVILKIPI